VNISPLAGTLAPPAELLDVAKLTAAYFDERPDPRVPAQRVVFGTSGHRGTAFQRTFNEWHVLAITEAICRYRKTHGIDGPLFLGIDTHALSVPASESALEVLAENGVHTMIAEFDAYTPTPVISRAIVAYNRGRKSGLADGIVISPSHNPPGDGGFKYNPPHGGPADTDVTSWIQARANELLETGLSGVHRMPYARALRAGTTRIHDYVREYVDDLANVVDMDVIRNSAIKIGVDPLGGAGVRYWPAITDRYKLDLTMVSGDVDPTFRFVPRDWDGQIRTDPSSTFVMQRLVGLKDTFDIAFACDADHDRHGIVTPRDALLPPNHYLAVMIEHLFKHRPRWRARLGVGKTIVSSTMIDAVTQRLGRALYEVPVGFKWFVSGLATHSIGFCGEESAGATFVRRDGTVWTTDKDGIAAGLLAAEITAVAGRDPGELYDELADEFGEPAYDRVEAAATAAQRKRLASIAVEDVKCASLAGDRVTGIITTAPGNHAPIGGVKVSSRSGWFAARPSGTEEIYKIYAESFRGREALDAILKEAQMTVDAALAKATGDG